MLECLFSCCYCLQLKEGLLVFVLPHVPATKHPPFSSAVWVNRFIRIGWSQSRCSLQCQSKLCLHSMLRCPLAAIWAKAESNNSNNNNQTIRSLWLMNLLWANAEFVWMFWEEKGWRNVCIGLVGLFFFKPVYTNAFHNPSKLTAPPASFFGTKKKNPNDNILYLFNQVCVQMKKIMIVMMPTILYLYIYHLHSCLRIRVSCRSG